MTTVNQLEAEKSLVTSLVNLFHLRADLPSLDEVERMATVLAPSIPYTGELKAVVDDVLTQISTRMGLGVSLVDTRADHDERWVSKRDDITWTYSEAYSQYLKNEKWNPDVVQKLSDVGDNILGLLQDPKSDGVWSRKGLVIGHVQSGKTANYLGVVGKAADAGYRFIIVIAGIHNNLRKQTQERIDSGFVGRSSDPDNRSIKGVGKLVDNYPNPVTVTNIHKDFDKSLANQFGTKLTDFRKPFVLVIKKNVHTLRALYTWLKDLNASKDGRISDVPMLMIDDEADNASINTNKEELDPTKTNALIRDILGLFDKSCYVGYTATPFANVFINPEIYDELFPKDFIYCLDAPSNYFGPDKVFIEEESSEKIVEIIADAEEYIPLSHKKDDQVLDLPPSLYRAIDQFILAKAIRNIRGQRNKHCSMMINVSRFVSVQAAVRDIVSRHTSSMKDAVKANYKMPEHISGNNAYMASLKNTFDTSYPECIEQWDEVKSELYGAFDTLKVLLVNSHSQDSLDYSEYERDGEGLTAIAVGGLSLSRGLTIEGLCISYMYRNTRMYDTLMQMGRWFGYRPSFEDLCKVHLNEDSTNWYAHIAEASEELRAQIKQMRRDKLSPEQFGLYVHDHPDSLLVTAANKMRTGEKIPVKVNLTGQLKEIDKLSNDNSVVQANYDFVESIVNSGFGLGKSSIEPTKKGWLIRSVPSERIEEFLLGFQVPETVQFKRISALSFLREIANEHKLSDVLLVSPNTKNAPFNDFSLVPQVRAKAILHENGVWQIGKGRLANKGDEALGLSSDQISEANRNFEEDQEKKPDEKRAKSISDFYFRIKRNRPLLMIHNIKLGEGGEEEIDMLSYGISFPGGTYASSVDVIANQVYIKSMLGAEPDNPDDEEDYDASR